MKINFTGRETMLTEGKELVKEARKYDYFPGGATTGVIKKATKKIKKQEDVVLYESPYRPVLAAESVKDTTGTDYAIAHGNMSHQGSKVDVIA